MVTSLVLSVVGLGVAAYLTYAHYGDSGVLACPDSGTVNCAKVTTSTQSELFGVLPVAVLGLAYFVVMLALCLPIAWRSAVALTHRLRIAGALVGVGMVSYLLYAELFQIKAICLYCTAVHVVTVLLFVVIVAADVGRGLTPPSSG
jgi:uncharacterized membrane protein